MTEPGTRFVVKRFNWSERYDGRTRQPGAVALASFTTFEAADAERAQREEAVRPRINPFECGPAVQYWTHLDEPRLRDWLMDHGITPPDPKADGTTDWAEWWQKGQKKLGAAKRTLVWEVLDKVRFFTVREESVRPVGYAVVMVNWEYNDEFYDAHPEQGEVVHVFRTRERAEAACEEQNELARDIWADEIEAADIELDDDEEEDGFAMFDMRDRIRRQRGLLPDEKLKKGEGLFQTTAGVPFYEVIEVSLEGLS
jgi:hypothetical protein